MVADFKTSSLDVPVSAGAKKKEMAYASLNRQGSALKKKYALGGKEYSGGSIKSSGRSGVARHKVAEKDQPAPRPVALVMDAGSGKLHWEFLDA